MKEAPHRGRMFYESPALIGCALAVHRELYDDARGFDPDMRSWGVEDLDFGLKCRLLGHRILHDPGAVIAHRFRRGFDNFDVPLENLVANQLRMARKNFTHGVWAEWVARCRKRHTGDLEDHPEGLWTTIWQLFEERRKSVEQERAYLMSRRVRDEFWYAERFNLLWPRMSGERVEPGPTAFSATAQASPQPSASPPPPPDSDCDDHAGGDVHKGWSHWTIPTTNQKPWTLTGGEFGVLTTPTRPFNDPFPDQKPVTEHAVTNPSYVKGFILEVEFSFNPAQKPIFPRKLNNLRMKEFRHRPTFLGNSGVGIYHWTGNPNGKYLYEVQVTDTAGMMGGRRDILHENRFVRLNYGANWDQKGDLANIPPAVLATEKTYFDPKKYEDFVEWMNDPSNEGGGLGGSADCICAIVAGLPVSYFKDVHYPASGAPGPKGEFPRPDVAVSSEIPIGPNNTDPLPISGGEDPLDMYYEHRDDYVAGNHATDAFTHFNHTDDSLWNTLWMCFLPARYDENGKKTRNAFLHTKVNEGKSYGGGFKGEIKSGTRASRHNKDQDPEPAVYNGNGDMKIRLLGHWGSTVNYRNIKIRSVGSKE